jgi:hypothetical protein
MNCVFNTWHSTHKLFLSASAGFTVVMVETLTPLRLIPIMPESYELHLYFLPINETHLLNTEAEEL